MIQAITNRQVGLKCVASFFSWGGMGTLTERRSVITELTVGFMIPGKPIAMMMCVPLRFFFSLLCFVPFCFVLSARCGASGAWC